MLNLFLLFNIFQEEKLEPIDKIYLVNSLIYCMRIFDNFL